jgi:hypothetical protein
LQNAHSRYSLNCSRRQRAFVINDDKSKEFERTGKIADERFSEFDDDEVGDDGIFKSDIVITRRSLKKTYIRGYRTWSNNVRNIRHK